MGNNLPYRMLPDLSSYLSFPVFISSFENRPAPFTGQMSLKEAKPGFSLFYVYFVLSYISFNWWIRAFVVLGVVFSTPSQEICLGKCPRKVPFCLEWDEKPRLSQPADCRWSCWSMPASWMPPRKCSRGTRGAATTTGHGPTPCSCSMPSTSVTRTRAAATTGGAGRCSSGWLRSFRLTRSHSPSTGSGDETIPRQRPTTTPAPSVFCKSFTTTAAFSALTLLAGRQEGHPKPVKIE